MGKVKDRKRALKAAGLKDRRQAREGTPKNARHMERRIDELSAALMEKTAIISAQYAALQAVVSVTEKSRSKDAKTAHDIAKPMVLRYAE